jgi:hypothetical protein
MTPFDFLNQLWEYKPDEQFILIWTGKEKLSRWFTVVQEASYYVISLGGNRDIYTGIGLASKDHGPHNRCPSDEIASICGIGADFDLLSEAHKNKALPQTIQQAMSIHPPEMKPTIMVGTGNGIQSWWLLKEPHVFENAQDRAGVARILGRWHTLLRLNAQKQGWAYERLADLARVLRIPGTRNCKDPGNPKDVTLLAKTDLHYNMGDFIDLIEYYQIPDPEAQEKAVRNWRAQFEGVAVTVDASARVPQELLDAWMDPANSDAATAMRFRNTWLRQRHDLKDQSNSGYDMALIHFALDAGLTEQKIVDLIVHHRAQNGQKQKLDAGYFRRSIVKARLARVAEAPPTPIVLPGVQQPAVANGTPAPPVNGLPAPLTDVPGSQADEKAPRPPRSPEEILEQSKLLLCHEISLVLGVEVVRMECIKGKEPTFHMRTADGVFEFEDIDELIVYRLLKKKIAQGTLRIINKIKPKEWDAFQQKLLDACIVREATEDEQFEGGARNDILDYLTETEFITAIEGQRVQDQKKPMIVAGRITVSSADLASYLEKTKNRKTSPKKAASMLYVVGARKTERMRSSQYASQTRYALPLATSKDPGFDPRAIKPSLYTGKPPEGETPGVVQ